MAAMLIQEVRSMGVGLADAGRTSEHGLLIPHLNRLYPHHQPHSLTFHPLCPQRQTLLLLAPLPLASQ